MWLRQQMLLLCVFDDERLERIDFFLLAVVRDCGWRVRSKAKQKKKKNSLYICTCNSITGAKRECYSEEREISKCWKRRGCSADSLISPTPSERERAKRLGERSERERETRMEIEGRVRMRRAVDSRKTEVAVAYYKHMNHHHRERERSRGDLLAFW